MSHSNAKPFYHSLGKAEPGNDIGVVDVDVDHLDVDVDVDHLDVDLLLGSLDKLLVVSKEDWWSREGDTLDCCPRWQQG